MHQVANSRGFDSVLIEQPGRLIEIYKGCISDITLEHSTDFKFIKKKSSISTYMCDKGRLFRVFRNMSKISTNPLHHTKLILGLRPTNEGRRYFVTASLIGWAQA